MDFADYFLSATAALLGLGLWGNARRTRRLLQRLEQLEARLVEGGPGRHGRADAGSPSRVVADLPLDEVQPMQLYYCSADGKVLLGVKKLDAQKLAKLPKSSISGAEGKLSAIASVLHAVPAVLPHARLGGGQPLEVLLNGPAALGRGSEPLMAMVKGATGKVVEQARVKGVPTLAALPSSAIVATATAVASRLSVDGLGTTLGAVLKGLGELRGAEAAERKAVIVEAVTHLRDDVFPALQRGHLSPVLVSDLEQVEHGLADMQQQMLMLHQHLHSQTKALHCEGEFDPDEFFKLLSDHVRNFDSTRKLYVLTLKARAVCWQFLGMLPLDAQAHQARRQVLEQASLEVEMGTDYEPVLQPLLTQIDSLDYSLSDDKALAHRKAGMQVYAQNSFENTRLQLQEIREELEKIAAESTAQVAAVDKPTRLAVRLEKGRIEAFELKDIAPAPGAAPASAAAAVAA